MTLEETAAPPIVHKLLLGALGLGSLILVPSILYMFRVFKGHTLAPWPSGSPQESGTK